MAKTSSLRDNFNDNVIAAAWGASYSVGSATRAETSSQARFTLPSSTAGTHEAAYATDDGYDLTADQVTLNVVQMVSTGGAAFAFLRLLLDTSNYVQFYQTGGTLYFQRIVSGATTNVSSVSWSSTTHKYWRLRESGGTIFWDTSSNGTSWTNRTSTANPFAVTNLKIYFGAGCGNVSSPGSFHVDDFNTTTSTATWRWTQVEWPLLNRFKTITVAATGGQGYLATWHGDDFTGNWRYWSGPQGGGRELTEQSNTADAEAMAVNLPTDGRWELPEMVETRWIKLFHRSLNASSYTIREYYPRRLVQSDDIEAETIKAIHIGAHEIVADHIGTVNLDATARVTAGNGAVELDDNGIQMIPQQFGSTSGSLDASKRRTALLWEKTDGTDVGWLIGVDSGFGGSMELVSTKASDQTATTTIAAKGDLVSASITTSILATDAVGNVVIANAEVDIDRGLNLGTASGAAVGALRASGGASFAGGVSVATSTGGLNVGTETTATSGNIRASGSLYTGAPFAAIRRYHDTNQSIPNATLTAINFNTSVTRYNYNSMANSSFPTRIIATTAGLYRIVGQIRWASNGTGVRELYIRLNGLASYIAHVNMMAVSTAGFNTDMEITTEWYLNQSDYVELLGYQNSGGALNIEVAAPFAPEFMASRIA